MKTTITVLVTAAFLLCSVPSTAADIVVLPVPGDDYTSNDTYVVAWTKVLENLAQEIDSGRKWDFEVIMTKEPNIAVDYTRKRLEVQVTYAALEALESVETLRAFLVHELGHAELGHKVHGVVTRFPEPVQMARLLEQEREADAGTVARGYGCSLFEGLEAFEQALYEWEEAVPEVTDVVASKVEVLGPRLQALRSACEETTIAAAAASGR